jgi:hypothetical protein
MKMAFQEIRMPHPVKLFSAKLLLVAIYVSLFLPLSLFYVSPGVKAATTQTKVDTSSFADTVIIMDNINEIKSHDPTGVRFSAAQLFVDMAPVGDSIGVVRIPSSSTPSPVQLLGLTNIQSDSDRALIKSKLSQSQPIFRNVDPGPTAYFVPALQTAGKMLNNVQDNNRKYIILVTDTVALSGDPESCSASPDEFHHWFCTVNQLEKEGISVILFGFTTPGPQAQHDLQPTKTYIEQHGGIVLQVEDGAGMPAVAEEYATLMTRIHPNIFEAVLSPNTSDINVSAENRLTTLTFVALSGTTTSLVQVQDPSGDNVAGKNSSGIYYNSSGSGYWLQTISSPSLAGPWHLNVGVSPPAEILVLGVSEARFDLLNPAPAHNDDISQRFVAPDQRIVLRASVTNVDGDPIAGVSFVANPNSDDQIFKPNTIPTSAIPGNDTSDISAVLGVAPAATNQVNTLNIGLGVPLTRTTYLAKQFQIISIQELTNKWVQVEVPLSPTKPLTPGDSITITGKGSTTTKPQSLSIFGRDASISEWTQINTSNSPDGINISGPYTPQRGCGVTYLFDAVEEISGTTSQGSYDYLAFDQKSYTSQIQQYVTGTATLTSNKLLSLWAFWFTSSQVQWNVTLSSTVCSTYNMGLVVTLVPDQFSGHIQSLNGGGSFTVPQNKTMTRQLTAVLGSCPMSSLIEDRTDRIQLKSLLNAAEQTEFIQAGSWQQSVTCPSFLTFARSSLGHTLLALGILFVLSVILIRLIQLPVLPLLPPKHLTGSVAIVSNAAALTGEDPPDVHTFAPLTVRIPGGIRFLPAWFLARSLEGSDTVYRFEEHESPLSLLQFKIARDGNGDHVAMRTSRYATGKDLPEFLLTRTPVGQDFIPYSKGEAIIIDRDIIYLYLDVAT